MEVVMSASERVAIDSEAKAIGRRNLLKLGGAAAAGAAVASALAASPAGAAAGDNLILGSTTNDAGTATTSLTSSSTGQTLLLTNTSANHTGADLGVTNRASIGDPGSNLGPNVRALIKSPVTFVSPLTPLEKGTGLAVWVSSSDPLRPANNVGNVANLLYDITDGSAGTASIMGSTIMLTRNFDNSYTGVPIALQAYVEHHANASATLIGADIKGRVEGEVTTATPVINGLEVGGEDKSQKIATNSGDAIHIVNQGFNDIRNAIFLASFRFASEWGTFENGLVMSTSSKGTPPTWSSTTTYKIGDVVIDGATSYQSKVNSNLGHDPTLDTTHQFWNVWANNVGPNKNFFWCGLTAIGSNAPTGTPLFQVDAS